MSDATLSRLERRAKDLRPRTTNPDKALEVARKNWGEMVAWARTILGDGDGVKEKWAVLAAKDQTPFFEECDECRDRVQRDAGKQGTLLSVWAFHILDPGHGSSPAPPAASSPTTPSLDDHDLTDRLREAAAQSPTSGVPASEPAAVATDLPKPSPVAPSAPPKTYPILHRGSLLYGDIAELADHLTIGVFVRDDGTWVGGETHSKTIWRREHGGRLPWQDDE